MNPSNHLVIVSNRPIPNLAPALDRAVAPQRVFLLFGPGQANDVQNLEKIYRRYGLKTDRVFVEKPEDPRALRNQVSGLVAPFQYEELAFNASCGSPIQICSIFSLFWEQKRPIFCVSPPHDELVWLQPEDRPKINLEDRLTITPFMNAFGLNVLNIRKQTKTSSEWKDLQDYLILRAQDLQQAISVLNYYASRGEYDSRLVVSRKDWLNRPFRNLLKQIQKHGLIQMDGNSLHFVSDKARNFLNGGWLENLVFETLQRRYRDFGVQDLGLGLEFETPAGNQNEMDVVFLADNHMHFIECKTSNMTTRKKKHYGLGVLYKLESITELTGVISRSMLVSYRDLKASDKRRAKDLNVKTVCAGELKNLESHLAEWVRTG